MNTALSVRANEERDQHIEAQERRIESLEEIIRVQADTIAHLTRTANLAESAVAARLLSADRHVHGGRRA